MKIEIVAKAKKQLSKLPNKESVKIVYKIEILSTSPYIGKKLSGKLSNNYSLRAWPYRIIYKVNKTKGIISIINVAHRQGAYN